MTGYEIYSAWCLERGQVPPTKEWWDKACGDRKPAQSYYCKAGKAQDHCAERALIQCEVCAITQVTMQDILADQREIDRERREGWAYD